MPSESEAARSCTIAGPKKAATKIKKLQGQSVHNLGSSVAVSLPVDATLPSESQAARSRTHSPSQGSDSPTSSDEAPIREWPASRVEAGASLHQELKQ